MNFERSVILLVMAIVFMTTVRSEIASQQESNINSQISNNFAQRNPSRSIQCFQYYIPYIEQLNKNYQKAVEGCQQDTQDGYAQAEDATKDKRNYLISLSNTSCNSLGYCSGISSAHKLFECFTKVGLDNTRIMYGINTNASENLSDLEEEFRLIDKKEHKCTNDTKRQYEKLIMQAYQDLDNCVAGNYKVPTSPAPPANNKTSISTPANNKTSISTPALTEASVKTSKPEDTKVVTKTSSHITHKPRLDIRTQLYK